MIKLSRDCISEEDLSEKNHTTDTLPHTENQAHMESSMQYDSETNSHTLLKNDVDAEKLCDSFLSDVESGDNSYPDEKASNSFNDASYSTDINTKLPNGISFEGKSGSMKEQKEVEPRILPSKNHTGGTENRRISADDNNDSK